MKNVYLLSLFLLCAFGLNAQVFFTESFESNSGDYTSGSGGDCSCVTATVDVIDGQNDHFADVTDADISHNSVNDYTGELDASGNPGEGTARYWASEDNDDPQVGGSGNPTQCVTISVDITGRMNLGFVGLFGGHDTTSPTPYESDNDMEVSFDIDGGGFTKVLDWHANAGFTNISLDTDNDEIGDGTFPLGTIFQSVAVPIAGMGTTLSVQICTNSNTSTEEFAFDYIRVREIPLPVDLTKFSAYNSVGTRDVTVEWETASEINNSHFNVQRSLDGINFDNVHRTIGYGTSSINHKYLHV
ncbi:MAG: hypothetical protein AAF985_16125, partial [Bacteroidota bacterium]